MTKPCHFCHAPVDPDAHNTWQATSCFSRTGRVRVGGTTGGADRVVYRHLEVFACDDCVQKLKRGRLHQEALL